MVDINRTIKLTKNLIVLEDLAPGKDPVMQVRNGKTVKGHPIHAGTLAYKDTTIEEGIDKAPLMPMQTAKEFAQLNPVLRKGEQAIESDTFRTKVGDGESPWNALPYVAGGAGLSIDGVWEPNSSWTNLPADHEGKVFELKMASSLYNPTLGVTLYERDLVIFDATGDLVGFSRGSLAVPAAIALYEIQDDIADLAGHTTEIKDIHDNLESILQAEDFRNEAEDFRNEAEDFRNEAEVARDAILQAASFNGQAIFETIALGMADTAENDFFWVIPNETDELSNMALFKNNGVDGEFVLENFILNDFLIEEGEVWT